ncbi:MAG: hypothetical protein IPJ65_10130 [Archangiaceae bacterium]|nr:hypothetical protein [Archangiaceae bacterium]
MMTLAQLLDAAAKASGAPPALAKQVAEQLWRAAEVTPELEKLCGTLAAALAAKHASLDAAALASLRAVVFGLEAMVREGDDPRALMPRLQVDDAAKEQEHLTRYGEGAHRCSRCNSQRLGVEPWVLLCEACGAAFSR